MFAKLRTRLGHRAMMQYSGEKRPLRQLLPISYVESVGIVAPGEPQADFDRIVGFMQRLQQQGKQVRLCAYSAEKRPPTHLLMRRDVVLLQPDDLAWNYRPNSPNAAAFFARPFDYLIDFTQRSILPLEWLVKMTPAAMRVGFRHTRGELYDITFALAGDTTVDFQLKVLSRYLNSPMEE